MRRGVHCGIGTSELEMRWGRGLWLEAPDAKVLLNNVIDRFPAWRGVCLLTEDEKMNASLF